MADRYWVGGNGTWNASNTTSWSATSGGASGASVPTSADNVFITSASSGLGVLTCSAGVCNNLTFSGFAATMTFNVSGTLTIHGNLTADNNGNTLWTGGGPVTFAATTTGKTITWNLFANRTVANPIVFNGVGGGWTFQDKFDSVATSNAITLTAGSLDINGKDLSFTGTTSNFVSAGSLTRSLTLGANTFILPAATTAWNITGTNVTVSGALSTITLSSANAYFAGGGGTYGTVTFSKHDVAGTKTITGPNTFNALNFTNIAGAGRVWPVQITDNQTITTFLTILPSNLTQRFMLRAATETPVTLTIGTPNVQYVDFRDIIKSGAAWTGTSLGDCGGNSNITFDTPKTVYQTGAGNNWATGWASTQTGTASQANYPLPQDTCRITNDSAASIDIDSNYNIGTILSTRTTNFTISNASTPTIYGNVTLTPSVAFGNSGTLNFQGRNKTQTFICATTTVTNQVTITMKNGIFALGDAYSASNGISVNGFGTSAGTGTTFNTNNYSLTCTTFTANTATDRTLNFGTSTVSLSSTGTAWTTLIPTGLTLNIASSTINLTSAGTSSRFFNLPTTGGYTFGTIGLNGTGISVTQFTNAGGNTITTLNSTKTTAHTVRFQTLHTTTFTNFNISGTAGNLVTIDSTVAGTQATVNAPSTISRDYLSIRDSAATGGPWYAGANSVNTSNNTGWIFTVPGVPSTGQMFLLF